MKGDGELFDSTKIKKIKYTINLFLQIGFYIREDGCNCSEDVSIVELLSNTEELDIFNTTCV